MTAETPSPQSSPNNLPRAHEAIVHSKEAIELERTAPALDFEQSMQLFTTPDNEAWLEQSESAAKYAGTLTRLTQEHGTSVVMDRIFDIQSEFKQKTDALAIKPSEYSQGMSWAAWDIAKQAYFANNPSKTDTDEYEVADPMLDTPESEKVRKQIVDRQIGWEYVDQLVTNPDFRPSVALATTETLGEILSVAAEEDRPLHSYELSSIGQILRESPVPREQEAIDTGAILDRIETKLRDSEPRQSGTKRESARDILARIEAKLDDSEPSPAGAPGERVSRRVTTGGQTVTPGEPLVLADRSQFEIYDPTLSDGEGVQVSRSQELINDLKDRIEARKNTPPTPEKKQRVANFLKRVGRAAIITVDNLKIMRQVGVKNYLRDRFEAAKATAYSKTEAALWNIADKVNYTVDAIKSEYATSNVKKDIESAKDIASRSPAIYNEARIQLGDGMNDYIAMWKYKKSEALARKQERKETRAKNINDRVAKINANVRARRVQKNPGLAKPAL